MATNAIVTNVVEQSLEPRIAAHIYGLSKMFRSIFPNIGSSNVVRPEFSNGWVIRRLFKEGLAGVVRHGEMSARTALLSSPDNTTSNPNMNILGEQSAEWFPGADVSTMPAYFTYQTNIPKIVGNMHAEAELVRTDLLDANKARILADIVDGAAKKVALTMCNDFLAETDTITCATNAYVATFEGCVLGKFDPGAGVTFSGTINNSGSVQTYTLASGSIRRFQVGQEVDLIAASSTADKFQRLNPANSPVHINISNRGADTITLINNTGGNITIPANTVGGATTNYVLIVPHGALANQTWAATSANQLISTAVNSAGTTYIPCIPCSIERFLKSTGGLCGTSANHTTTSTPTNSISLSRFPEYKSYVESIGAALDERTLIQRAARCEYAGFMEDDMWDEAWTTPGSFAAYSDSLDGYYTMERNGKKLDLGQQGMSNAIGFGAFGKTFTINVDPWIGRGKLYGEITRNKNFRVQVAPRAQGSKSAAGFPSFLEFFIPKMNPGNPDIWQGAKGVATSGTNAPAGVTTTLMEAPFMLPYQIDKDNYRGMKLTDLTEDYGPVF